MPEFSLSATYCTPAGRPGSRDVLRKAATQSAAIDTFYRELSAKGHTKIDIRGWPANTWKDTANA